MRARKIHGVTVTPRWEWSKDYRRLVLDMLRPEGGRRTKDDYIETAIAYARWLAARDGIDLARADREVVVWDWDRASARERYIKGVHFYEVLEWSGSGRYGTPRVAVEKELVAKISIPNHDWQPTVTEHRQPARAEVASALESLFA